MKITVTQYHIDNGQKGSCTRDPIALALKDAGVEDPWVSPVRITFGLNRKNGAPVPAEVLAFMRAFDSHEPVSPFTFELGITDSLGGE